MHSSTASSFSSSTSWGQSQQPLDAFQQPRQTYQSGYLLSSVQGSPMPSQGPRFDNPSPIPTKSKSLLPHAASSDYGSDTSFDRSRPRQSLMDEDAPPINSVADIIGQAQVDPHASVKKFTGLQTESPRRQGLASSRSPPPVQPQQSTYYVLVFGYPPTEYAQTANLFAASGDTTAPEPCTHDGGNWFKIGFRSQYDFNRALRRNGELINGTYMIGVVPAESDSGFPVGSTSSRGLIGSSETVSSTPTGRSQAFPSFGKPLALMPASAAYKSAPAAQPSKRSSVVFSEGDKPKEDNSWSGKISDMIFGW